MSLPKSPGPASPLEEPIRWLHGLPILGVCDPDQPLLKPVQWRNGLPLFYEDELPMGDADLHTLSMEILHHGLKDHLRRRKSYRVYCNLNVYYHPEEPQAYISPDVMVVKPRRGLPIHLVSYTIGVDGPAPRLTAEVLSRSSFQHRDLGEKATLYADLGVPEYLLVDPTGEFLPEKLSAKAGASELRSVFLSSGRCQPIAGRDLWKGSRKA